MAIDLNNIQAATQLATGIALVLPQKNAGITAQLTGEPAFLFDYEGEQSVDMDCDITDHVSERNDSLEDQIALKPERFHTKGFIGELNDIAPIGSAFTKTAQSKLVLLGALMPEFSVTALVAFNAAAQAAATAVAVARASVNAAARAGLGSGLKTKQQAAYERFKGYRKARRLFTVQSPWEVFQDMAIESFRVFQDDTTEDISSFEITFKQMSFSKTATRVVLLADGRAAASNSDVVNQGSQVPAPTTGLADQLSASGIS